MSELVRSALRSPIKRVPAMSAIEAADAGGRPHSKISCNERYVCTTYERIPVKICLKIDDVRLHGPVRPVSFVTN